MGTKAKLLWVCLRLRLDEAEAFEAKALASTPSRWFQKLKASASASWLRKSFGFITSQIQNLIAGKHLSFGFGFSFDSLRALKKLKLRLQLRNFGLCYLLLLTPKHANKPENGAFLCKCASVSLFSLSHLLRSEGNWCRDPGCASTLRCLTDHDPLCSDGSLLTVLCSLTAQITKMTSPETTFRSTRHI